MRKKLLWIAAMLFCLSVTAGYSGIHTEQEETEIMEYEYDELNRVTKAVYPDGTTITYQYDKNGNLLETVVLPPEGDNSATEGTDHTEEEPSGTEVPEKGLMNTEYTSGNRGDHYNGSNSDLSGGEPSDSNGKEEDTSQDIDVDKSEEALPENGTQRIENEKESLPEEARFPWGWILAAVSVTALAGGAVWRSRRRKQDEE